MDATRRWKPARSAVIVATGILYGIPSLALFVVLPVILGTSVLSPLNVIVALLLYGLALVLIMLVRPAGLWPSPNREERPNAALAREEEEGAKA